MTREPTRLETEAIAQEISNGSQIAAIKLYRECTGKSLNEAKEFIDDFRATAKERASVAQAARIPDVTPAALEKFLAQQVPRTIPKNIQKRALSKLTSIGSVSIGIIFALGTLFIVYLVSPAPSLVLHDLCLDLLPSKKTESTIDDTFVYRKGFRDCNNNIVRTIYGYRCQTQNPEGKIVVGTSYCKGKRRTEGNTIRFQSWNPSAYRLEGCTLNPQGRGMYLFILFSGWFFFQSFMLLRSRWRRLAVLRKGQFTTATVSNVHSTSTSIGNDRVYKVTLQFKTPSETSTTTYKALGENGELAKQKQERGETVGLLYNPKNHRRLVVLDTLVT